MSMGRGFQSRFQFNTSTTAAEPATGMQCSATPQLLKLASTYTFCIVLTLATTCPTAVSADVSFSLQSSSYKCGYNVQCLGQAQQYSGSASTGASNRIQVEGMSLISQDVTYMQNSAGLVYYNEPVRLLDPSTGQSASFATNFQLDVVPFTPGTTGDGMTFVMSENNSTLGSIGDYFGIFTNYGVTNFKTIVVEFDGYQDDFAPVFDIDNNHVSFDFSNIATPAAKSASTVDVFLWDNITIYAWVEYTSESKQLEVRVSNNDSRPVDPLLIYTVDLFDVSEEFMWVGFSAGNSGMQGGDWTSNYYVGNWTFQTYGIAESSPPPSTLGPSSVSGEQKPRQKLGMGLTVGISVGVPALLACILIAIFVRRRVVVRGGSRFYNLLWKGSILFKDDAMKSLEPGIMPEHFTYKELSVATGGFSKDSKLGQGGFGSVHRGVLPSSGIAVAVKKISSDSTQGLKEFMTEVSIVGQLRHRNLIQLLGWCRDVTKEQYLLVYNLMPNGSLDKALFWPVGSQNPCLSWPQRFNILTGTAAALDYLHQGWEQKVIHRDVKSSNIMLDQDWNAKLGDFGLARLVDHERTASMTAMAGTYGYIAPEVATSGQFTYKADVYAFGVVVLEVACGRKALQAHGSLVDWVWQSLETEEDLLSAVDERLHDYDPYWMRVVLTIGLVCAHPNALDRPSMRQVVQVLAGDVPVPSLPRSKLDLSPDACRGSVRGYTYSSADTAAARPTSTSTSQSLELAHVLGSTAGSSVKSSRRSSMSGSLELTNVLAST